jgi:hypothetical protein
LESAAFRVALEEKQALVHQLRTELEKRSPLLVDPFVPDLQTPGSFHILEVKRYFAVVKRRLPRTQYLDQVQRYITALQAFFTLPLCWQGENECQRGFPFLPQQIAGLLRSEDLRTPRTGGRAPSPTVQGRKARIVELKQQGVSTKEICACLDSEHYPLPDGWRQALDLVSGTWKCAYQHSRGRQRIQELFSKAAR